MPDQFFPTRKTPAPFGTDVPETQPVFRGATLAADAEALDQVLVAGLVLAFEVVEELPALGDHFQKATAAVVVLLVGLEVLGERRDARGQDRHLDFGRTGVAVLGRLVLHQLGLFFGRDRHRGLLG